MTSQDIYDAIIEFRLEAMHQPKVCIVHPNDFVRLCNYAAESDNMYVPSSKTKSHEIKKLTIQGLKIYRSRDAEEGKPTIQ